MSSTQLEAQSPIESATTDPATHVVAALEAAWNAGDGAAFGAVFTEDAVFVDVRGDRHYGGRDVIAAGHQGIFDSIYRGSTVGYRVDSTQAVGADVLLVHGNAVLECPTGPLAGTNRATFSIVMSRLDGGWQAVAFHNTLVPR